MPVWVEYIVSSIIKAGTLVYCILTLRDLISGYQSSEIQSLRKPALFLLFK